MVGAPRASVLRVRGDKRNLVISTIMAVASTPRTSASLNMHMFPRMKRPKWSGPLGVGPDLLLPRGVRGAGVKAVP